MIDMVIVVNECMLQLGELIMEVCDLVKYFFICVGFF